MTRALHKLSDAAAKAAKLPGRYSDGGGLYLNVTAAGTKSWVFMWVRDGKRKEMGLGGYPRTGLAKARGKALECRDLVADGQDPIAARSKTAEPTFAECVDQFLASMEPSWRNEKHRAQWRMTLTVYCPDIQRRKISTIVTSDVLNALTPIWREKPETASRLRGRIERVLDFAKARGWRSGENPALWRGHLKNVLPARQRLTRGHHAALPYEQVPALMKRLNDSEAMAARALMFLIFTAGRSGEVLGCRWSEIDFNAEVWTVPATRMKAGKEHRVPLAPHTVALLSALETIRVSDFVFPGQRPNRPLSGMAMEMLLRRLDMDHITVHGFRSAFRDWAGDRTAFPREVAEAALAHTIGSAVERAYRRSDALEKRRQLMTAWAAYASESHTSKSFNGRPMSVELTQ